MSLKFVAAALGALFVFGAQGSAQAQDFYAGKTITILVGSAPGGGIDLYPRTLAPFMRKHIAGNPNIIVQNQPSGGGIVAVMNVNGSSPKDGTVMAAFNPGLVLESIVTPEKNPVRFSEYVWVGAVNSETRVCFAWGARGIKDWNDLKAAKQFVLGTSGKGTGNYAIAAMLREEFGMPIKQVVGFPGSGETRLAIERGELDGDCGAWSSTPPEWIRDNKINLITRVSKVSRADVDHVPYIGTFATTQDQRDIAAIVGSSDEIGRPLVMSKQVPADRLKIIRDAFDATMVDKEYLTEMERLKLSVAPTRGADIQQAIDRMAATPPQLVTRLKKLFE